MMFQSIKFNQHNCCKGQSAIELAIFGSILIFVVSLIFRQGLSGGNFMRVQLQAMRYSMSKSLEMASSSDPKPGRNSASTLVIEDRLSGDFANKFGSRDRTPMMASGNASLSNQLFYPIDADDFKDWDANHSRLDVLPHYDVVINGQKFSFITANFHLEVLPLVQGSLKLCTEPHPTDTRCWDPTCGAGTPVPGCVVLQKIVQNYPGSGFVAGPPGNFDLNFDGTDPVAAVPGLSKNPIASNGGHLAFMWQWQAIKAMGELPTDEAIDVDGDFHEEQILGSTIDDDPTTGTGRTLTVMVIDRQLGDLDFTHDARTPAANKDVGLLQDSQMLSFTNSGTYYRIQEGKLLGPQNQFIRNINMNDHVDVVQRIFQLSNDTGRFCNGNTPRTPSDTPAWDGGVAYPNPVEACNNCSTATNASLTCFDQTDLKLYVRSRIVNKAGRSWFTRTEVTP